MTMLAAPHCVQPGNSMHGSLEDDFLNFFEDLRPGNVLYTDVKVFTSYLEERNEICNSVSSSTCPSPTSDISSSFDIGLDILHDDVLFERTAELTPLSPLHTPLKSCQELRKIKSSSMKKLSFNDIRKNKWSSLSSSQQVKALENVMETVSQQLGLREQLEIIKIINPDAQLLPTDTEFFIDFDLLDDEKFDSVRLFVDKELRKQKQRLKEQDTKKNTDLVNESQKKDKIYKLKRCKRKHEKLKRTKQLRKEKLSGLFSHEQVIAVETSSPGDDVCEEEIDILT